MHIFLTFITLAFSALLPVINPIGSALVFLGIVGPASPSQYKSLALKIAYTTALLLLVVEVGGSFILGFFGISLSVVQLAGGAVLAAMGWNLLNQKDGESPSSSSSTASHNLGSQIFYPLTFPVTAGPGCIVVALTLSAHATHGMLLTSDLAAHAGIFVGILFNCGLVYACYAYAPGLARRTSPETMNGILRIIAFILLCIGVQIAWNGLQGMLHPTKFE